MDTWVSFLVDIFASNTKLETVSLGGDWPHNAIMRGLNAHCYSLKHVRLGTSACQEKTFECIIAMIQGCPLLESIYAGAWNSPSDIYDEEADFIPSVSVTNAALYAIAQHCPHLTLFKIHCKDALACE